MAFSRGERSMPRRRDVRRQRLRILFTKTRALAVEYVSVGGGVHLLSFLAGASRAWSTCAGRVAATAIASATGRSPVRCDQVRRVLRADQWEPKPSAP